jgi:hypothetical protein
LIKIASSQADIVTDELQELSGSLRIRSGSRHRLNSSARLCGTYVTKCPLCGNTRCGEVQYSRCWEFVGTIASDSSNDAQLHAALDPHMRDLRRSPRIISFPTASSGSALRVPPRLGIMPQQGRASEVAQVWQESCEPPRVV